MELSNPADLGAITDDTVALADVIRVVSLVATVAGVNPLGGADLLG